VSVSLDPVRALIAADMAAVDALIRRRLASDVVLIGQVAEYIIGSGGKRLRPAVLLLSAGACDYPGPHHHELAAVVDGELQVEVGLRPGRLETALEIRATGAAREARVDRDDGVQIAGCQRARRGRRD